MSSGDDLGTFRPSGHVGVHEADVDGDDLRVLGAASSRRSELVSDHDAAFAAQYRALGGAANHDSTDSTLTIAPPPLAASTGANARLIASGPNTFVSNSRCSCVHRVVGQHPGAGADPGVVDQQRDVAAARHGRLDVGRRRDVQLDGLDAADVVTVDTSRTPAYTLVAPRSSERRAQRRSEPAIPAGDQRDRSCNVHARPPLVS